LLSYTRLGHRQLRWQPIDLEQLAHRAFAATSAQRLGRNVELSVANMRSCTGDPELMQQVFEELFANALEATVGRERAHIEVGCESRDKETLCFVRDNGCGFAVGTIDKAFDLFQRLREGDDRTQTGAGLAFTRRIVQRHGGRIWAESQPNTGTTFFFSFLECRPV